MDRVRTIQTLRSSSAPSRVPLGFVPLGPPFASCRRSHALRLARILEDAVCSLDIVEEVHPDVKELTSYGFRPKVQCMSSHGTVRIFGRSGLQVA